MQSTLFILTRKSKNRMQRVKKKLFYTKSWTYYYYHRFVQYVKNWWFSDQFFRYLQKRPVWSHLLNLVTAAKYFFFYSEKDSFHKASFNCLFRVEHSVHVESVPYNKSTLVGQMPYLCHDFESCQVVSSRVETSHFRSKRSRTNKVYVFSFFFWSVTS